MARKFIIRIERTDREGVDPVHIRADTREHAESFVREMYGDRVVRVIRPRKRGTPEIATTVVDPDFRSEYL